MKNYILLPAIAMICADTTRTKAYLQVMGKNGIKIHKCYIMTQNKEELFRQAEEFNGIEQENALYFNREEPLLVTLNKLETAYQFIEQEDINAEETIEAIRQAPEQYFIYSGLGGQILRAPLFSLGKKYIHVHAGIVPQYRGSTTIYYSMLQEGKAGATVMFLNEQLDEGDILAQETYTLDDKTVDIDYVFEPFTRAETLVKALKEYGEKGEFHTKEQPKDGNTYYIIHPVLKHIAMLQREQ